MKNLIDYLVKYRYIKSESVKRAFEKVDRRLFVPESFKGRAYSDHPLPIGFNQTISAPSMIAIMLEALDLKRGDKVLEIGTGSGYNAALISEIVGDNVFSIERIPELAEFARDNLRKAGYKVKVLIGDGTLGYEAEAPYDKIIVTAAAPKIPDPLIKQLKIGGKICIPVGERFFCDLILGEKLSDGKLRKKNYGGCAFVPLIGKEGW
ncbi:protein-L-isoaspartate(D-aspartate) O-methyltransferase [bacterium]|nr:protein-L-isoaspartate(D-aspartate) O-methyltransferase [Methanomicrobia archaeon]MCD6147977.1 protein-L-isoaspartate(D-aspartate) O-methyltransferase [bacterium]